MTLPRTACFRKALAKDHSRFTVAAKFWNQYCATKDIASYAQKPGGLQNGFEWYITYKSAARTKCSNAALEAQVRSEEAWRRAIDSDRKTREKTARAEEQNRTARESYLRQWNAEAAVAAASPIDEHYKMRCINMQRLFNDLGIAA